MADSASSGAMPDSRPDTVCFSGNVTVHSVTGNTLCDAQIWSILPHIAQAASGISCFRHENASRCPISRRLPREFHASGMKTPPGTVACVQ